MLTQKQRRILRYLMAQEAAESGLCFKDARCIARGLFGFGSYEASLVQFRKLAHREPDTILPALLRDDARMSELRQLERRPPQSASRGTEPQLQVPRVRPARSGQ